MGLHEVPRLLGTILQEAGQRSGRAEGPAARVEVLQGARGPHRPTVPGQSWPGPIGSDELQRVGQGVAARVGREVQDSLVLSRGEAENRAKGREGVPGTA